MNMFGAACIAAVLTAAAAPAMAERTNAELGMALSDARAIYPEARAIVSKSTGTTTLELSDVEFVHTRWRTVDFIFNNHGRLDRVQLMTTSQSFDDLEARLAASEPSSPMQAESEPIAYFPSDVQLRLCDRGDLGVYLTYERPSQAI